MAELLTLKPLFPGKDEKDTLAKILLLTGKPDLSNWKDVSKLPNSCVLSMEYELEERTLFMVFPELDENGLDLFGKMLCFDPSRRLSAMEILRHEWFDSVRTAFAGN